MASTLTLYPPVNFLFSKPPVLSKSDAWQPFRGTLPCPPVNPRDRHMQYVCDLLNG
jgi:hypothetical protein